MIICLSRQRSRLWDTQNQKTPRERQTSFLHFRLTQHTVSITLQKSAERSYESSTLNRPIQFFLNSLATTRPKRIAKRFRLEQRCNFIGEIDRIIRTCV